jgi:integrase
MGGRRRKPGKVKVRRDYSGRVAYTALYLPGPEEDYISAGTFDTYDEAEAAWITQAECLRRGVHVDPRKGRTLFRDFALLWGELYVSDRANTIKGYEDALRNHLLPTFGHLQLQEITPEVVARWVADLNRRTYAASSIRSLRGHLSGILSTALLWRYIAVHPCAGVKVPKEGPRRIRAYERADIDLLLAAMPGPVCRLLVWVDVHSGLRWGELTELRGGDVIPIDPDDYDDETPDDAELVYLRVQRSVSDVGARHADGSRFLIEATPKSGRDRNVGLDPLTSTRVLDHIERFDIGPNDLLFPLALLQAELEPVPQIRPDMVDLIPEDLGRTAPNAHGRTYAHGTPSGYNAGGCKCLWCRRAIAQYRAERRRRGLDLKPPHPRGRNTSDHLPRDYFRRHAWLPAVATAGITGKATFHDLRHTHATWLARDGVSIEILRDRLGHASLVTTQKYISASTHIDTTAAQAMARLMTKPARRQRRRNLTLAT